MNFIKDVCKKGWGWFRNIMVLWLAFNVAAFLIWVVYYCYNKFNIGG